MGNKTLILGANSTVGRMLRHQWSGLPDLVWVSRTGPDHAWTLEDGAGALEPLLRDVSVVVCLAGATPGAGLAFDLNSAIARAVVDAAAAADHVFLASTMAVYGDGSGPHVETGPTRPGNDYGASKLEMERAGEQAAAQSGVGLTSLRLANIVGADMLFRNIAAGRAITLDQFDDGATPVRSYLDPELFAAALLDLIGKTRDGHVLPGVLNLASDPAVMMGALLRTAGIAFATRPAPDGARRRITMDVGRAKSLIPALAAPRDAGAMVAAWRRARAMA
ncbi:MAG: NAD-dependent epimerase/dehydratase family protein [Rhodobacter sp.]|nr:NAD-dependent epimerase/dehydratase family protein [Rhodobacter sp.]